MYHEYDLLAKLTQSPSMEITNSSMNKNFPKTWKNLDLESLRFNDPLKSFQPDKLKEHLDKTIQFINQYSFPK